ncbi:MAG: helix-turn-helix domain-containing protein, partial [Dehalococcoidia bacterium]
QEDATMTERFDWERDCGSLITPTEAGRQARSAGQAYEDYAEQYRVSWPFAADGDPPADLVDGMVAAMMAADLLTTNEVAAALGITPRMVRYAAKRDGIGRLVGRDYVFSAADVEALRTRKTAPGRVRSTR